VRMNSVDTFKKRLSEEIAAVEQEIQAHNHQVEALRKRLEGLKRADELFESDQAAIAELLQASIGNGSGITQQMATAPRQPQEDRERRRARRRRVRKSSSGAILRSAAARRRSQAPIRSLALRAATAASPRSR